MSCDEMRGKLDIGYGYIGDGRYDVNEYIITVEQAKAHFTETEGEKFGLPDTKIGLERLLLERGFEPMTEKEFDRRSETKPFKEYARYKKAGIYNFETGETVRDIYGELFTFNTSSEVRRFISTQGELSRMGNKNNGLHRLGLSHLNKLGVILIYEIVDEGQHDTILEGEEDYMGRRYYY